MDSDSDERFGAVLRRLRIAAGLSQEALSERSGVSVRGISDLERGRRTAPRFETVRMLSRALDLDDTGMAQLIRASRPSRTPPARGADLSPRPATQQSPPRRYNLPHTLTRLIGREHEVAEIISIIRRPETRLLTLTGPGGTGKTRLAIQVSEELEDEFADGVHFVPLVPLNTPHLVLPAIAEVLRVRETGGQSLRDVLVAHARDLEVLLLLDNFEHVLAAAADIHELLAHCRGLKLLVTSRAALNLQTEHIYNVDPLALPRPGADISLADASRFDALALFIDRARMADARFAASSDNISVIHAICRQLDGLPLGIELAAARTRALSLQEIQHLLTHSLTFLTGGARDLPLHQQTLHNTITWSYNLLSEDARHLFRRLAVFAGGWTLEAAHAVASGRGRRESVMDVFEELESLIDQSMIRRVDTRSQEARFGMLQTIREFGLERLEEHGEEDETRHRHARYFLSQMRRLSGELPGANESALLRRIDEEHDNVRAALRWLINQRDAAGALGLCSAMGHFWGVRGYLGEGIGWLDEALDIPAEPPGEERAAALITASILACYQDALEEARQYAEASMALANSLGDDAGIASALHVTGLVAQLQDDYPRAAALYEQCLTLERPLGHPKLTATIGNLAQVKFHQGDTGRAIDLLSESIQIERIQGPSSYLGVHLTDLGLILNECGDVDRALDLFMEALKIHQEVGNMLQMMTAIEGLAGVAVHTNQPAHAALLFGGLEGWRELTGNPREQANRWHYQDNVRLAREQLGDDAFLAAWNAGRALTPDELRRLVFAPRLVHDPRV